jgi:hypothetical protein
MGGATVAAVLLVCVPDAMCVWQRHQDSSHAIGIVAVIPELVERGSENAVYPHHTPRGIHFYPIRFIKPIIVDMVILCNLPGTCYSLPLCNDQSNGETHGL